MVVVLERVGARPGIEGPACKIRQLLPELGNPSVRWGWGGGALCEVRVPWLRMWSDLGSEGPTPEADRAGF